MSPTYPEFRGRHVVVTGAAAGIGLATARAFAAQGAIVTGLDRDAAPGGEGIDNHRIDLTELDRLPALIEGAVAAHGPVRALVNNAGVDRRIPFDDLTPEVWRQMMALNLDHAVMLAGLVAPSMAGAGGGAVVSLSSTAWMKLAPNLTAYHTAKAGIIGMTKGLARDLGARGIRANAIAPGRVMTERVEAGMAPDWVAQTHEIQCLKDMIRPADIADCALWLSSEAARMLTGQVIVVDGGVV
ncbi:SDR family NAD(P)-dependent oxidoreductase [Oceanicola sp. S124]|uniref:SDR family NAD(P)-dependent oxidoreductase n=1 Tax=Oceanicola sp. S124 TaxID=1042378 RepID=UPI00025581E5|nr:SDR family NAD(P)-dependent oxidoreductase [Oceanicola sp. S124]